MQHIPKLRIFTLILGVSGLLALSAGCPQLPTPDCLFNRGPIANAGPGLTVCVGDPTPLNGLSSDDPDGDSLFYNWAFTMRPLGSRDELDSANIATPSFVPTVPGVYELSLTVTDGCGASDEDTVRVVAVACDGNPCEGVECPPEHVCSLDTGECEPICEDDAACLDDDPCTNDLCIGGACHNIAIDCDDGEFCNGVEVCVDGECHESESPCGDNDMLVIKSATLPSGRSGLSCVTGPGTGKIYCFGGWDGTNYSNEILEYDPANPNRDPVITATLPTARSGLACAASSPTGKIYCFGGFDSNTGFLAEILAYDPGDPSVNPVPMEDTLPEGRVELACATGPATGKIYCFGGGDGINHRRDILEYDPNTDTLKDDLTAILPPGTTGMSCVADPGTGKIYCFGGWNGTAFDQVLEYDPGADKLNDELTARLPSGRHGLACAADRVSGRIYCFGGRELGFTAPPTFNQILEYDPAADTLDTMSAELPSGNSDLACAASLATGKIYCFGGWDGTTYFDDILEYTPSVCDEDTDQCRPSGDPINKSIAVCCDNSCGPCAPSGACTVCGGVQLCAPRYATTVQTGPVLQLEYSVPDHCSSIRLNIYVDGAHMHTTGWLGWPGAPPPFDMYPLSTGDITLSVSSGTHQLELEAEGQPGGCNDFAICSWGGTLTIQPAIASE